MNSGLLDTISLTTLHGVGASQSEKLSKIGLNTVQDLLLHLPLRYEDHTRLYQIRDLLPGTTATIVGEVLQTKVVFGRKRMMTCLITDGTGNLTLRFFNFSAAMKNSLAEGRHVIAYGEVRRGNTGPEIIHPEYKVSQDTSNISLQENLTPVYPTTEGVRQATLRKLIEQALKLLEGGQIKELLPEELSRGLISLPDAIRLLHTPPP
ncbi:ATP-dependent DNA helicase recG [Providencia stuartii]|nr:ATP-dependent DNA helicase recG [Providencia stuartii]